jgi:hypothetical protein
MNMPALYSLSDRIECLMAAQRGPLSPNMRRAVKALCEIVEARERRTPVCPLVLPEESSGLSPESLNDLILSEVAARRDRWKIDL